MIHTNLWYEKRIQELKEMITKTDDEVTINWLEYRIKTLSAFINNDCECDTNSS